MSKDKAAGEKDGFKIICRNRRALHDYEVLDTVECGLALTGTEVKSLRGGRASLDDSFARVENDEVWLYKADIPEYAMGNIMNHEPKRKRKLLLHRREIEKFARGATERGFTLIPLKIYFRKGLAKLELALAKGKKLYDKRDTMRSKDAKRDIDRAMRNRRRD